MITFLDAFGMEKDVFVSRLLARSSFLLEKEESRVVILACCIFSFSFSRSLVQLFSRRLTEAYVNSLISA
jgi:hypothetical protein